MFILWALSYVYAVFGNVPAVAAVFYGLKPAVLAIVTLAVIRIGGKALKNPTMWGVAAVAFVCIFFAELPFPVIVVGALLIGYLGGKVAPAHFAISHSHGAAE
jgi:chromate transporter